MTSIDSAGQKATRQHTKQHNSTLVLRTIYDHETISRASIARITGLTRATTSDVVADLIRKALVEEVGPGPSAVGRTPVLLSVAADSRALVGIDIANGRLHGALVNLRGNIRQRVSLPLPSRDGVTVVAQIHAAIDTLMAHTDLPVLGIGIGTPGLVDSSGGGVRRAVNMGWHDLPLRTVVQERYQMPVYVANDSHLAALAEYTFGAANPSGHLVVLQIGRGIGAGIVLNGQLFAGDNGSAGEIGHVVVDQPGLLCRCGNRGCLETVASSRALVAHASQLAAADQHSLLHRFAASPTQITLESIRLAAQAGDTAVLQLIHQTGQYLGIALAHIVGLLNVRQVVVTGRVAELGPLLLAGIQQAVEQRLLAPLARDTDISIARLGADAVILGAAALVLASELGLVRPRRVAEPHAGPAHPVGV